MPSCSPSQDFYNAAAHRGEDDEEVERIIKDYSSDQWTVTQFVSNSSLEELFKTLACFSEEHGPYEFSSKSYKVKFNEYIYEDSDKREHKLNLTAKILKVEGDEKHVIQLIKNTGDVFKFNEVFTKHFKEFFGGLVNSKL